MGPSCHRPNGLWWVGRRALVVVTGAPDYGRIRALLRSRPLVRPPAPMTPVRGSGGGEELEREAGADGRGGQRGRRGRSRVETASGVMVVASEAAGGCGGAGHGRCERSGKEQHYRCGSARLRLRVTARRARLGRGEHGRRAHRAMVRGVRRVRRPRRRTRDARSRETERRGEFRSPPMQGFAGEARRSPPGRRSGRRASTVGGGASIQRRGGEASI